MPGPALGRADGVLALHAPASVPWWRTSGTDLYTLLVHMGVETARHLGHLDIRLRGIAEASPGDSEATSG